LFSYFIVPPPLGNFLNEALSCKTLGASALSSIACPILELIEHIPRIPWCIANAYIICMLPIDCSIEHAQDSLVQACAAVVSIGVSGIGVAMMGNKKALFVTLVGRIPRFEAY
jgi:hypothetical protein